MHIVLVSGSHRPKSQSSKVANYIANAIKVLDDKHTTDIIDLAGNPLPLWEEDENKPYTPDTKDWAPIAERVKKADGLVIVSPEWHGMVPSGLKNFFLYCGNNPNPVAHKPALIVGVSASRGGSYPVAELRMSSYKNSRILYLPEHVLVQNAGKVLNGPTEESTDDAYLRRRIDYALRILFAYTDALIPLRASGVTVNKEFANGM